MKQRVISAIIMVLICLPFLIVGSTLFKVGIGLISILAVHEILSMNTKKTYPPLVNFLAYLSVILIIYIGFNIKIVSLIFILYFFMAVLYFNENKFTTKEAFLLGCFTIFLGMIFSTLMNLYLDSPLYFFLLVFVCVFTDIFAYTTGRAIGKHKVTKISPKKTIEGFVGGLVMGTVLTSTYYMMFIGYAPVHKVIGVILFLCIACELGDLFYSAIKRQAHIKDFSNLIPGHGGILDRIDSLTIVTLVYIVVSGII